MYEVEWSVHPESATAVGCSVGATRQKSPTSSLWSVGNKNRFQFLVPSRIENYLPDSHQVLMSSYRKEILQFPNTVLFIMIPYNEKCISWYL